MCSPCQTGVTKWTDAHAEHIQKIECQKWKIYHLISEIKSFFIDCQGLNLNTSDLCTSLWWAPETLFKQTTLNTFLSRVRDERSTVAYWVSINKYVPFVSIEYECITARNETDWKILTVKPASGIQFSWCVCAKANDKRQRRRKTKERNEKK